MKAVVFLVMLFEYLRFLLEIPVLSMFFLSHSFKESLMLLM